MISCLKVFVLVLLSAVVQARMVTPKLSVESAVEIAINNNPGLAEMRSRFEAISQIPSQAGALPDPTVSLNAMNFPVDTFDRAQEPMTQIQFGISQAFPFPGKRSLREQAAEYLANAAGFSVAEMRIHLMSGIRAAWWQIYYLDRALETVASNQMLLKQFIKVAKTKYETGKGLQQDVLLSQLELSKLLDHRIQLKALRDNQATELNLLMGRPPAEPLRLDTAISEAMPKILADRDLQQRAAIKRPLLRQKEQELEAAESRLELAKKEFYPDFTVGLSYGDRTGRNPQSVGGARADFLSLMIGVKVPLYSGTKQSYAVRQRSSEYQQHRYALLDQQAKVNAQIAQAVTDYHRAREQYQLFKQGILPQARQTVSSMLAGYQVNRVDFLNLARSQITLFNYELQYWKVLTEANQALSRLQAAVGEEQIYE